MMGRGKQKSSQIRALLQDNSPADLDQEMCLFTGRNGPTFLEITPLCQMFISGKKEKLNYKFLQFSGFKNCLYFIESTKKFCQTFWFLHLITFVQ